QLLTTTSTTPRLQAPNAPARAPPPSSFNQTHRLAFGLFKGTDPTTAPPAVSFVSDKDFSLRKPSHIINVIPPPAAAGIDA
ncbi:hypothetical protein NL509_27960, partial [Klebsiella pneumoniae]|nr:hypothetical protein [Klebsiella pneumoniae]